MNRTAFLLFIASALLFFEAGMSARASPSPALPIIETSTTQTLTQAAPTLITQGMSLGHVLAFRVSVCAVGGNLSGSGTLRAYVYVPTQAAWIHNPDQDLTVTNTGVPCQLWSDRSSAIHKGRVHYVNDTVTTSAGTTTTNLIEAVVQ